MLKIIIASVMLALMLASFAYADASIMPYDCGTGLPKTDFAYGEDVCVYGTGYQDDQEVDLYVVDDQDAYSDGQAMADVTGSVETVTAGGFVIALKKAWTAFTTGLFDLFADLDRDGTYDDGEPTNIGQGAGLTVSMLQERDPVPEEPIDAVPEFGTIGALAALVGANGYVLYKRRRQR
ncbi:hypothetical protein JXB02_02135 [Candidatus Woesearchaeota archaeon]|nr:hypothetical protein [Candidatus Woesearchaeota archaeon]